MAITNDEQRVGGGNEFDVVSCVYVPTDRASDHRESENAADLVEDYGGDNLSGSELREQ